MMESAKHYDRQISFTASNALLRMFKRMYKSNRATRFREVGYNQYDSSVLLLGTGINFSLRQVILKATSTFH